MSPESDVERADPGWPSLLAVPQQCVHQSVKPQQQSCATSCIPKENLTQILVLPGVINLILGPQNHYRDTMLCNNTRV